MKIITKKRAQQIEKNMSDILSVLMELPSDALGSGATRSQRVSRLYRSTADLAYMVEGVKGLNKVVSAFSEGAKTMDDIVGLSQAHLEVLKNREYKQTVKMV